MSKIKNKVFIFKILLLFVLLVLGLFLSLPLPYYLLLLPLGFLWFFPIKFELPHILSAFFAATGFILATQYAAGHVPAVFSAPYFRLFNNYLIYLLPFYLCSLAARKTKIPFYTIFILGLLIGVIQFFTEKFRGFAATIIDLFSLKTAANFMTGYSYEFSYHIWVALVIFLLTVKLFSLSSKKPEKKSYRLFFPFVLLILSVCGSFIFFNANITPGAKNSVKASYLGVVVTFFDDAKFFFPEKPALYEDPAIAKLLETPPYEAPTEKPDIIVIMNEALFDFDILLDVPLNADPMPFYHSAAGENFRTGHTVVPSYAGNTCNSEYEFLTNCAMLFQPKNSTPFMLSIHKELPALPAFLKELGYETVGIHPTNETDWRRHKVYPLLGIDRFLSIDDTPPAAYPVRYTSDRDLYDWSLSILEEADAPQFLFVVTMQNHAAYKDGFKGEIYLTEQIESLEVTEEISSYFSLCYESDKALSHLITALESRQRPTVLLMFGDHAPSITDHLVQNGKNNRLAHATPYLLYANYPITTPPIAEEPIPLPYLNLYLSQIAGLPLNAMQTHLLPMAQQNIDVSIFADRYSASLAEYWAMCYTLLQ